MKMYTEFLNKAQKIVITDLRTLNDVVRGKMTVKSQNEFKDQKNFKWGHCPDIGKQCPQVFLKPSLMAIKIIPEDNSEINRRYDVGYSKRF